MKVTLAGRWAAWCCLLILVVVTVGPIGLRPTTSAPADFERIMAFALCSTLFCIGYPDRPKIVIPGLILTAAALELAQTLSPTRHAHFSDFLAKAAGVLLGTIICYAFRSLLTRARSN